MEERTLHFLVVNERDFGIEKTRLVNYIKEVWGNLVKNILTTKNPTF